MKYIKTYEERKIPKVTTEERTLMNKVRYAINKFWGKNCCGVSISRELSNYRFTIYSPSYIVQDQIKDWELKKKYWINLMNEIRAIKLYNDDSHHLLNEEQMREIVARTKYINMLIDTQKYNL